VRGAEASRVGQGQHLEVCQDDFLSCRRMSFSSRGTFLRRATAPPSAATPEAPLRPSPPPPLRPPPLPLLRLPPASLPSRRVSLGSSAFRGGGKASRLAADGPGRSAAEAEAGMAAAASLLACPRAPAVRPRPLSAPRSLRPASSVPSAGRGRGWEGVSTPCHCCLASASSSCPGPCATDA